MAKSKPFGQPKGKRTGSNKSILNGTQVPRSKAQKTQVAVDPAALLAQATALLYTGQPDAALPLIQRTLGLLRSLSGEATPASISALNLLGEVYLELGDPASAADTFLLAVHIDPDGSIPEHEGGGAEKFLWLAQLCEEGGEQSIEWFEKGVKVLQQEVETLELERSSGEVQIEPVAWGKERVFLLEEKRKKLAAALCGMVEVWMTDLSLSPAAESTCTSLISQALAISPNPSTLQTHASLLLSQCDLVKAQSALTRSLLLWQDLSTDHFDVPDFSTRISLSRLLMEAEMDERAMVVLERLVAEDDSSVEGWYLGGWCALLMAGIGRPDHGKRDTNTDVTSVKESGAGGDISKREIPRTEAERQALLITGQEWLRNSLRLYDMQGYEDDRLRDHAVELVEVLDSELEESEDDDDGDEGAEGWEDEEGEEENGTKDIVVGMEIW